ncbi:hypothetical protein BJ982_005263 [Sphaerisporangium siamense]|uniref:Uncharacterized protein n=1 Tax=Sphaerisporangium siamense TaxID=795645 RepID=A0A7W7GCP3_9ACTN|nr:hypothetical protein [Sphaerisporangium siamense]
MIASPALADCALLQPGVVVDGDAGELGQLFPPQPGHAAPAPGGDPGVLRGDGRAPGTQEVAEFAGLAGITLRVGWHDTSLAQAPDA